MPRPKLEVNEVYILQEIMPYEGSSVLGVFYDVEVAKSSRGKKTRWHRDSEGDLSTRSPNADPMSMEMFYAITKYPIRTK